MFCSSIHLELWCLHNYYHLAPFVLNYCSVGYLSDSIDHSLFLSRMIYWRWCVSSYFIGRQRNTWLYSCTWCLGVLPSVKLHTLHGSVVSTGVTVLLGLCNLPHRGCGELAKPGLLYPLAWIPYCGIVFVGVVKQSRLLNKWFGILGNVLW
jgi:hypothetical protein